MSAGFRDVQDRGALQAFEVKRAQWLEWFEGDPAHDISRQLSGMMWADTAYWAVNEMRDVDPAAAPTAALAPLLAEMIDAGYVATQVLAIGRLVDRSADVISPRRLVDDLRANAHLFTREMFVCHDGVPFDPAAAEDAYWAAHPRPPSGVVFSLPTQGRYAARRSEARHAAFDRIGGWASGSRVRTDRLPQAVFDRLVSLLDDDPDIRAIREIRHKFIAHSADVSSRAKGVHGLDDVTGLRLQNAQRALVRVAGQAGDLLQTGSGNVVPHYAGDQFAHLQRPFVAPERLDDLRDWWAQRCASRDGWLRE